MASSRPFLGCLSPGGETGFLDYRAGECPALSSVPRTQPLPSGLPLRGESHRAPEPPADGCGVLGRDPDQGPAWGECELGAQKRGSQTHP